MASTAATAGAQTELGGEIARYDLVDWWLGTFTPEERARIESLFRPPGVSNASPLTRGHEPPLANSAADLLSSLATWLHRPQDRPLARRVLAKAGERALQERNILELHFTYHAMIQLYYRDRQDPEALNVTISACEKQIALARWSAPEFVRVYPTSPLPGHCGYDRLSTIRAHQRRFSEALRLASTARQQGWSGNWDDRIRRIQRQLKVAGAGRAS